MLIHQIVVKQQILLSAIAYVCHAVSLLSRVTLALHMKFPGDSRALVIIGYVQCRVSLDMNIRWALAILHFGGRLLS